MKSTIDRAAIVAADKHRVWHPYTEMSSYIEHTDPLVIARAQGPRIFDVDGRSYLDANSSWWVASLGHNHPRLVAALTRQANELCHVALAGVTHEGAALLAEELCAVAPSGLTRVFYSDNGSTAVESAVKLAVQFASQNGRPRRTRLVALEGAFHGETVGATSLGGVEVFRRPFAGILFDCVHVPPPLDDASYARAFDELTRAVANGADEVAAVVLEPLVQGASGMRMYAPDFLRHARALCDRHEIPLVLDEVFTGYGRTGPMWAASHAGIVPDLLCTAKGFSGGMMPIAATLATEHLFSGFLGAKDRAFFYGHSYAGNPLGTAIAREVLRVYADEQILARAETKARRIAEHFTRMAGISGVRSSRALGMIGALDFEEGGHRDYLADVGWRVYEAARRRGAYLRPLGNVIYIAPPLNIPDDDLEELLDIVEQSVREAVQTRTR